MKTENTMTKAGAALFLIWGILHIWVGFEGLHQYLTTGTAGQWNMLIGGSAMPREAFQFATDAATLFVQGQLILNFTMDVGASGVLGLIVAWMMWKQPSWLAFALGAGVIGIVDLSFLIILVMSGVTEFSFPVLLGPIVWFLAVAASFIGLRR
jgi:hypothetical protein